MQAPCATVPVLPVQASTPWQLGSGAASETDGRNRKIAARLSRATIETRTGPVMRASSRSAWGAEAACGGQMENDRRLTQGL